MKFEIAYQDDQESIVKATQISVLNALERLFDDLKKDGGPGPTWEQLEHILNNFKTKEARVIILGETGPQN